MGNSRCAHDSSLAESMIGLFKKGMIRSRGPRRSIEAVEFAILDWVDLFNNRRLLEPIGCVPPLEFEQAYHVQESTPARFADYT